MANAKYNAFKAALAEGEINLETDSLRLILVDDTYIPDIDNHITIADVTGEVTDTSISGYQQGGKVLTGQSVTQDNVNDTAVFSADDVIWNSGTSVVARGAVIFHETTETLIAYFDFGSNRQSDFGGFAVQWNPEGILTLK